MSALEKAARLKKQAFAALDRSTFSTVVRVDFNELIDVCIAFEEAASGDYENLEFSAALAHEQYRQMKRILSRIADLTTPDSAIWKLCYSEYDPEFNVDPDVVLRKLKGEEQ